MQQRHPILAAIAATTTPMDDVAQELMDMIDARAWAVVINVDIQPPVPSFAPLSTEPEQPDDDADQDGAAETDIDEDDEIGDDSDQLSGLPGELARMVPTNPGTYERWRALWAEISERHDATNKQLADDLETSVRTVQRIRAVGAAGLLDSPQPPNGRVLRLASSNGLTQRELNP